MTDTTLKKEDFLFSFSSSITNTILYTPEHPMTLRAIEKSFNILKEILEEKDSLRISVLEERLFIDDEPIWRKGIIISNIIEKLKVKGLNSISFLYGIEFKEFLDFINEFSKPVKRGGSEIHSTPHIKIGKLSLSSEEERVSEASLSDLERKIPTIDDEMEALKKIFRDIESSRHVPAGNLKEIVLRFVKGLKESISPLLLLIPFKSHEEYLYSHSINVCILTLAQGESL